MSTVDVNHVWKIYEGGVEAVKDVSFRCENGEFAAILGPSGCGKSSTLRMIAGLEEITRGELLFDGQVVNHLSPRDRNIALAFESYALYPPLTVYENIAFPLQARGIDRNEIDRKVRQIAEALELTDVLRRKPANLSGGQEQRVSLARALVRDPNVFLLDEPLSHMDQRVRAVLRARIRRIHDELNTTTIYVTHDQEEAVALADRIILMNLGVIQQIGTVDELWEFPANEFVAGFLGTPSMNFIDGRIEAPDKVWIATNGMKAVFGFDKKLKEGYRDGDVTVGIRPDKVILCSGEKQGNALPCVIEVIEPQGEQKILTGRFGNTEIKVLVGQTREVSVGITAWLEFNPESIHLFDKETGNSLTERE